jgi:hypothetical protein
MAAKTPRKRISRAKEMMARSKARADPNFDIDAYLSEAEKDGHERREHIKTLSAKLGIATFEITIAIDAPYYSLREPPLSTPVVRRLAQSLLNDDPLAMEYIEQFQKTGRTLREATEASIPEIKRLATEAGHDAEGFGVDEPLPKEWTEFYYAAQETQAYKDAIANHFIQRERCAEAFHKWLSQGEPEPKSLASRIETTADFFIHTSQEIDALSRAQCDGKSFNGYLMNDQAGAIIYERKGLSHRIQLALTADEQDAGLTLTYLEKMVRAQDSDGVIAALYIMGVLAPPSPLPPRDYAGGWIDFNDVISKIGWYPQTTIERREMHARIWEYIRYGEKAQISGKRTIKYYEDTAKSQEIETEIHRAAWRVMKTEVPIQNSLYTARDIPFRAEIVMSQELTSLITAPKTAQYLPMAEVLGSIAGGQPSGAWARVIGLALASVWRRNPREANAGILKPTRRELLDHYTSKIAPYQEILASKDPGLVIKYWCGALKILADSGFIARGGEACIRPEVMRKSLPRQGWRDVWLDETVDIRQGAAVMAPALKERAEALPTLKPRDLKAKPRKKTARAK